MKTSYARLWTFNKRTYFNTFQNGSLVRRWLFHIFIEFLNVRKEVRVRKEILPQKNLRVNVSKNQRKLEKSRTRSKIDFAPFMSVASVRCVMK